MSRGAVRLASKEFQDAAVIDGTIFARITILRPSYGLSNLEISTRLTVCARSKSCPTPELPPRTFKNLPTRSGELRTCRRNLQNGRGRSRGRRSTASRAQPYGFARCRRVRYSTDHYRANECAGSYDCGRAAKLILV